MSERLIEGVFGLRARHDGNGVGYSSIVGSGAHAATLHWIRNDGRTTPGELLLMDMGVEANSLYTADVTRTIPVSGTFTPQSSVWVAAWPFWAMQPAFCPPFTAR